MPEGLRTRTQAFEYEAQDEVLMHREGTMNANFKSTPRCTGIASREGRDFGNRHDGFHDYAAQVRGEIRRSP
jgi:hypothetical protein